MTGVGEHFDALAVRYAASREHAAGVAFPAIRAACAAAPPGLLADVGCGPAALSRLLAEERRVVGVDLAAEMLRVAAATAPPGLALARASAAALPFGAGSVAAVVMRFVAQHLEDLPAALAEAARVLAPGGVLVVSDTVAPADPVAREWQHRLEVDRDPHHQRLLTVAEWGEALAGHGLAVAAPVELPYRQELEAWAGRVAMPPGEVASMAARLRAAPPAAVAAFGIGGEPLRWTWQQAVVAGRKPDG